MERRKFLESCLAVSGTVGLSALPAWARDDAPALRADAARRYPRRAAQGPRARRRDQLHLPLSVRRARRAFCSISGGPRSRRPTLRREDGTTYAWNGGVGPSKAIVALLGDLRAQARLSDARRVVHPLSAAALGDVRRAGDPLLRGPQRLRSRVRRARAGGTGAAAARRDPARLRCRDRRALRRSARWAPSSSTRSSGNTNSSWRSNTARRRRRKPVGGTTVVRELAQYCKQTIQC